MPRFFNAHEKNKEGPIDFVMEQLHICHHFCHSLNSLATHAYLHTISVVTITINMNSGWVSYCMAMVVIKCVGRWTCVARLFKSWQNGGWYTNYYITKSTRPSQLFSHALKNMGRPGYKAMKKPWELGVEVEKKKQNTFIARKLFLPTPVAHGDRQWHNAVSPQLHWYFPTYYNIM